MRKSDVRLSGLQTSYRMVNLVAIQSGFYACADGTLRAKIRRIRESRSDRNLMTDGAAPRASCRRSRCVGASRTLGNCSEAVAKEPAEAEAAHAALGAELRDAERACDRGVVLSMICCITAFSVRQVLVHWTPAATLHRDVRLPPTASRAARLWQAAPDSISIRVAAPAQR